MWREAVAKLSVLVFNVSDAREQPDEQSGRRRSRRRKPGGVDAVFAVGYLRLPGGRPGRCLLRVPDAVFDAAWARWRLRGRQLSGGGVGRERFGSATRRRVRRGEPAPGGVPTHDHPHPSRPFGQALRAGGGDLPTMSGVLTDIPVGVHRGVQARFGTRVMASWMVSVTVNPTLYWTNGCASHWFRGVHPVISPAAHWSTRPHRPGSTGSCGAGRDLRDRYSLNTPVWSAAVKPAFPGRNVAVASSSPVSRTRPRSGDTRSS